MAASVDEPRESWPRRNRDAPREDRTEQVAVELRRRQPSPVRAGCADTPSSSGRTRRASSRPDRRRTPWSPGARPRRSASRPCGSSKRSQSSTATSTSCSEARSTSTPAPYRSTSGELRVGQITLTGPPGCSSRQASINLISAELRPDRGGPTTSTCSPMRHVQHRRRQIDEVETDRQFDDSPDARVGSVEPVGRHEPRQHLDRLRSTITRERIASEQRDLRVEP